MCPLLSLILYTCKGSFFVCILLKRDSGLKVVTKRLYILLHFLFHVTYTFLIQYRTGLSFDCFPVHLLLKCGHDERRLYLRGLDVWLIPSNLFDAHHVIDGTCVITNVGNSHCFTTITKIPSHTACNMFSDFTTAVVNHFTSFLFELYCICYTKFHLKGTLFLDAFVRPLAISKAHKAMVFPFSGTIFFPFSAILKGIELLTKILNFVSFKSNDSNG